MLQTWILPLVFCLVLLLNEEECFQTFQDCNLMRAVLYVDFILGFKAVSAK